MHREGTALAASVHLRSRGMSKPCNSTPVAPFSIYWFKQQHIHPACEQLEVFLVLFDKAGHREEPTFLHEVCEIVEIPGSSPQRQYIYYMMRLFVPAPELLILRILTLPPHHNYNKDSTTCSIFLFFFTEALGPS